MKINIGCGPRNFGKNWIHIDGGDYDHVNSNDIFLESYNDESIELIYASHFLEYFDRDEIVFLLKSWRKKLKKNAKLRVAVPNFKVCAKLYLDGLYPLDSFLGPFYGKMKMGTEFIYHKTIFDFKSLYELLFNVGMRNIDKYDWSKTEHSKFDDHSQAFLPHMDKQNGTLISLNVECVK